MTGEHAASLAHQQTTASPGFQVETDTVVMPSGPGPDERSVINDGAETAARDTTDLVGTGEARETFIPVSRQAMFERLTDEQHWEVGQAEQIRRFYRYLAAWRHLTYMERLMDLKEAYLPFSPDRDTVAALSISPDDKADLQVRLRTDVRHLLERANYREINRTDLNAIFAEDSTYGLELHVDVEDFEELQIYARGATTKPFRTRAWKKLYLGFDERQIPIFQRLLLLVKLKDDETRIREIMRDEKLTEKKARKTLTKRRKMLPDGVTSEFVYLKLFKEIPRTDLKMMFPNTRVQFRFWDKLKLTVTAGGGTLVSVFTTATKILASLNPISAVLALVGLVGVIFRQVMKFFNQRNQYMMVLAQNLYFHTLADNRGVLTLVCDRAEEEDTKEEMLLYAFILRQPIAEAEFADAQQMIENWLEDEFNVRVTFDFHDALERLMDDGIVSKDADGIYQARPPGDAAQFVDEKWDAYLNTAPFFADRDAGPAAPVVTAGPA